MSIQVNAGANAVNWESILSSLGNVQKADGVDGKSVFTVTTNVDGEARTLTVNIPSDLEIPENVDKGTLEGLIDKLAGTGINLTEAQISTMKDAINALYTSSAGAMNEVSAKSRGSVMFDLYALMALMIEAAQSQRDAAREIRTSQNMLIQQSIQNQADQQRQAAMIGMWVGIACGAASALASIGTMVAQGVAAKTQSNIMSQSGADSAKMHSAMLQNTDTKDHSAAQLQQTKAAVGENVATRVENDFKSQLTDDQAGNLGKNFNDAVTARDDAKVDVARKEVNVQQSQEVLSGREGAKRIAQTNYEQKTATVDQKQQAYDQAVKSGAGEEAVNAAKAELDTAKAEQASAKTQLDNASKAVDDQNQVVANAQRDLANAQTTLAAREGDLVKAKADYVKTVQDVAAQYQEKYQTAVERRNNPPEGANKATLEADVTKAKAEMQMAFAKEADLLSQNNVMSPSEQKDLVATARARVDVTMDRVMQRTDFKAAERKMSTLMGINNINQAIGGVLQSTAQHLSTIYASDATREGAEKQREEEMLDQTKDLFQQEQKVIDQVVQLCGAILQAETQSMRDAIQA